jgi:uncharacterized membrane protein
MDQSEEIKIFRRFVRRTKYSMGILGIVVHALLANLFFSAPDIATNTAHNKAGLWATILGILLIAAIIETGMLVFDKINENIKKDGEQ